MAKYKLNIINEDSVVVGEFDLTTNELDDMDGEAWVIPLKGLASQSLGFEINEIIDREERREE